MFTEAAIQTGKITHLNLKSEHAC